jgi:histidinol dehydrogenase
MEMVAQAEHDPRACVIVVVVGDERLADEIEAALARAATSATKSMIVRDALAGQGGVLRVRDVEGAIAFANAYAPEHLLLLVADAAPVLEKVRNAGTVFVGAYASVAFGDYMTGANHVLPTGGSARTFSGLSPLDFVRWTTYQRVDASAGARLSGDVATFALSEGLPAHAAAAVARASNNI